MRTTNTNTNKKYKPARAGFSQRLGPLNMPTPPSRRQLTFFSRLSSRDSSCLYPNCRSRAASSSWLLRRAMVPCFCGEAGVDPSTILFSFQPANTMRTPGLLAVLDGRCVGLQRETTMGQPPTRSPGRAAPGSTSAQALQRHEQKNGAQGRYHRYNACESCKFGPVLLGKLQF